MVRGEKLFNLFGLERPTRRVLGQRKAAPLARTREALVVFYDLAAAGRAAIAEVNRVDDRNAVALVLLGRGNDRFVIRRISSMKSSRDTTPLSI